MQGLVEPEVEVLAQQTELVPQPLPVADVAFEDLVGVGAE